MAEVKHRLVVDERQTLTASGVLSVDSYDENRIELSGVQGGIDVGGVGLKIAALDLEQGKITISGQIDGIVYGRSRAEKSAKTTGKKVFRRLLK